MSGHLEPCCCKVGAAVPAVRLPACAGLHTGRPKSSSRLVNVGSTITKQSQTPQGDMSNASRQRFGLVNLCIQVGQSFHQISQLFLILQKIICEA